MMRLTKIQIIDETVEYYSNNPRALSFEEKEKTESNPKGKKCLYKSPEGLFCGHSRCLTDEGREQIINDSNTMTASAAIRRFGDDIHKEEYRGHNYDFWRHIQDLHDTDEYWNSNILTEEGKKRVEYLKDRFKNN